LAKYKQLHPIKLHSSPLLANKCIKNSQNIKLVSSVLILKVHPTSFLTAIKKVGNSIYYVRHRPEVAVSICLVGLQLHEIKR